MKNYLGIIIDYVISLNPILKYVKKLANVTIFGVTNLKERSKNVYRKYRKIPFW